MLRCSKVCERTVHRFAACVDHEVVRGPRTGAKYPRCFQPVIKKLPCETERPVETVKPLRLEHL
eukprot:scaffold27884_cov65-Phaeocystis_antarctica.AAC.5